MVGKNARKSDVAFNGHRESRWFLINQNACSYAVSAYDHYLQQKN